MATDLPKPNGLKRLEELAAKKAIQLLLQSQSPDVDFANLEPIQQQLVFKYHVHDYRQLRDKEEKLRHAMSNIPHLDQLIYRTPPDVIGENWFQKFRCGEPMQMQEEKTEKGTESGEKEEEEEDQTTMGKQISEDENLMASVRSVWSYGTGDNEPALRRRLSFWTGHRLKSHSVTRISSYRLNQYPTSMAQSPFFGASLHSCFFIASSSFSDCHHVWKWTRSGR